MSKELRVAIAKDVLERIVGDEDVVVATSKYVKSVPGNGEPAKVCQVCAIGGMMVSCLENRRLARELGHDKTLNDLVGDGELYPREFSKIASQVLGKHFSDEQLGMIEAAFESDYQGVWGDYNFDLPDDYGDIVSASSLAEYRGYREQLSKEELAHFYNLQKAVNFGKRFEADYSGVRGGVVPPPGGGLATLTVDYRRDLLKAIMENIVRNGEFKPEDYE